MPGAVQQRGGHLRGVHPDQQHGLRRAPRLIASRRTLPPAGSTEVTVGLRHDRETVVPTGRVAVAGEEPSRSARCAGRARSVSAKRRRRQLRRLARAEPALQPGLHPTRHAAAWPARSATATVALTLRRVIARRTLSHHGRAHVPHGAPRTERRPGDLGATVPRRGSPPRSRRSASRRRPRGRRSRPDSRTAGRSGRAEQVDPAGGPHRDRGRAVRGPCGGSAARRAPGWRPGGASGCALPAHRPTGADHQIEGPVDAAGR